MIVSLIFCAVFGVFFTILGRELVAAVFAVPFLLRAITNPPVIVTQVEKYFLDNWNKNPRDSIMETFVFLGLLALAFKSVYFASCLILFGIGCFVFLPEQKR